MKAFIGFLMCLAVSGSVFSQTRLIKGRVEAADNREPLGKSVVFLQDKDSLPSIYTVSSDKGEFSLKYYGGDDVVSVCASCLGYKTRCRRISFSEDTTQTLLPLEAAPTALDEVALTEKIPLLFRRDTLVIHPDAFRMKEWATVEDLLKKIDGFEVAPDGKIKINGIYVSKVQVNGEDFFKGSDVTLATRNFAKDYIRQIEITDDRPTDAQAVPAAASDRKKKINLILKKELEGKWHGKLMAGIGAPRFKNGRIPYEYGAFVNNVLKKRQITAIVNGNNINVKTFNDSGSSDRELIGITDSRNINLRYVNMFKEKYSFNTDYSNQYANTQNQSEVNRENLLPDRVYFTEENAAAMALNNGHKVSSGLYERSGTSFFSSAFITASYDRSHKNRSVTARALDENRVVSNRSSKKSMEEADVIGLSAVADFSRKIQDPTQ